MSQLEGRVYRRSASCGNTQALMGSSVKRSQETPASGLDDPVAPAAPLPLPLAHTVRSTDEFPSRSTSSYHNLDHTHGAIGDTPEVLSATKLRHIVFSSPADALLHWKKRMLQLEYASSLVQHQIRMWTARLTECEAASRESTESTTQSVLSPECTQGHPVTTRGGTILIDNINCSVRAHVPVPCSPPDASYSLQYLVLCSAPAPLQHVPAAREGSVSLSKRSSATVVADSASPSSRRSAVVSQRTAAASSVLPVSEGCAGDSKPWWKQLDAMQSRSDDSTNTTSPLPPDPDAASSSSYCLRDAAAPARTAVHETAFAGLATADAYTLVHPVQILL